MAPGEIVGLSGIPFIDHAELSRGGRFLANLMYYDGRWRVWARAGKDKFVEILGEPAEAFYFAPAPENELDFTSDFLTVIAQRANFSELVHPFSAIQDDIFNLSAAIAKLELVFENQELERAGSTRMAATEVEYILFICRGLFDFLQEIVTKLWDRIELHDTAVPKRKLKKSFADMTLKGDSVRTAEEIAGQFHVPMFLAEYYARQAPIFIKIREFRDNLVHRGQQVQTIFRGNNGFVINKRLGPFLNPNIWRDDEELPNELVPLLPALALLIHGTMEACEAFALVLQSQFTLPKPVVPGMALYMRGYFNHGLVGAMRDANQRLKEGRTLLFGRESQEPS
jgi:hypothetical protein